MQKRYQVFVSSTFEDLKAERQAAVEAILKSGHIPAGMELFTAGDRSQMDVIRGWIEQSDIFMLILGARYGSIEPSTGLSYVELEFNYARERKKPFFAVVLSERGRDARVREHGLSVIEQQNETAYRRFRNVVTSHLCAFFDDAKSVKLAVFETIPQLIVGRDLVGWVSARDVAADPEIAREMARLSAENQQLRKQRDELSARIDGEWGSVGSFRELTTALDAEMIDVPEEVAGKTGVRLSLLALSVHFAEDLARGVSNSAHSTKEESFVFYGVASRLATFGLVEHGRVPSSVYWQRLVLSKMGSKFLTRAKINLANASQSSSGSASTADSPESPHSTTAGSDTRPRRIRRKASMKKAG